MVKCLRDVKVRCLSFPPSCLGNTRISRYGTTGWDDEDQSKKSLEKQIYWITCKWKTESSRSECVGGWGGCAWLMSGWKRWRTNSLSFDLLSSFFCSTIYGHWFRDNTKAFGFILHLFQRNCLKWYIIESPFADNKTIWENLNSPQGKLVDSTLSNYKSIKR